MGIELKAASNNNSFKEFCYNVDSGNRWRGKWIQERETLADMCVDGNKPVKWGKWMMQKGGERITGATSMRDKRTWGL